METHESGVTAEAARPRRAVVAEELRRALTAIAPDAGALDDPADHLVVQQQYAPGGVRDVSDRGVDDRPDEGEITRRMAWAERVVEELERRGVEAVASVEETDDGRGGALFEAVTVETRGTLLRPAVLVGAGSVSLYVDREHDEEDGLTYREAYALVRQVHEALQVATGLRPVEPDTVGQDVLSVGRLDDSGPHLHASTPWRSGGAPPQGWDPAEHLVQHLVAVQAHQG